MKKGLFEQIKAIQKKTEKKLLNTVVGAFIDISSQVIQRTPVLTGRLKNNWIPEINTNPRYSLMGEDKTGNISNQRVREKSKKIQIGDVLFFVNNLSYARDIEYGKSKTKAPQGMLRISIEEAGDIIKNAIRVNAK